MGDFSKVCADRIVQATFAQRCEAQLVGLALVIIIFRIELVESSTGNSVGSGHAGIRSIFTDIVGHEVLVYTIGAVIRLVFHIAVHKRSRVN